MDLKYIPEDWKRTKEGIGTLIGLGVWGKGIIDKLKKLDDIMKKAESEIRRYDVDRVIHFQHTSQKSIYQELYEDYEILHDFSSKVGQLIDTEIDQPFYEDIDTFAEAMRELTIEKYETRNTIGAKETIGVPLGGSYTQTVERIKDKITVSDIFTSNNVFKTSLKEEFDSYMRAHPKSNMSYDTYQKAALNSRAFGYESIKDGQQKQEFWRNIALAALTIGATILCPPAGIALAASIAVMELSSSATGKDWGTGRKLDTNERWLRGAFAIVDILPAAKGMVAFGDVTTGLKAGATTVKSGSKIGLEEGGSRLKQIDNLLAERAQNAKRLSVEKLENLSLNIARKIDTTHTNIKISAENLSPNLQPAGLWDATVENKQWFEKKTAHFFENLNLKSDAKDLELKDLTKGTVKIDYDLAKDYIRVVESKTGLKLHKKQIEQLKAALRENMYEKMTPLETLKHRNKFNSVKNKLISEWEEKTGQKWPRYTEEVYDIKGRVVRDIGQPYDAHHIIENNFGGPHEWWNIHPAKFPDEHQAGIHGKGSPSNKLFPRR